MKSLASRSRYAISVVTICASCGASSKGAGVVTDAGTTSADAAGAPGGKDVLPGDVLLAISDSRTTVAAPESICTDTGWCWQRPRPQYEDLYDLWAGAEDDVWAVGYQGMVLHWDGKAWSSRAIAGVHTTFHTVWGAGKDVWVGGDGIAYHWNGSAWEKELGESTKARHIFGSSASDLWMTTEWLGAISHRQPQGWAEVKLPSSTDSCTTGWASGPTDVWFCCNELMHYDGQSFSSMGFTAYYISGSGPNDIWAADQQSVLHWDGKTWSPAKSPSDMDRAGMWRRGQKDVWIVSEKGALQSFDGNEWTKVTEDTVFSHYFLTGFGSTTLWTGGGGGFVLRGDGNTFSPMTEVTSSLSTVKSIWAFGADDAWAASTDGILRRSGADWTVLAGTSGQQYRDVWAAGPKDVWLLKQNGALAHWDGASLVEIKGPPLVADAMVLAGSGADNLWEANVDGWFHWDGAKWTKISDTNDTYKDVTDVWTGSASDSWAVNARGQVLHWDGNAVTAEAIGKDHKLQAIWGAASNDIWIGGEENTLYHWDGTAWKASGPTIPPAGAEPVNFLAIGGAPNGDIWALGNGGQAYRWDGSTWTSYPAYTYEDYSSISVTPDGGVFIAGFGAGIMYRAR